MTSIQSHPRYRHTICQLCFIYGLAISIQWIARLAFSLFSQNSHMGNLFENTIALLGVVCLISYQKSWPYVHWFSSDRLKDFPVFIFPAFYILLNMGDFYDHSRLTLMTAGINTVISAAFEELLCRAFALHFLMKGFILGGMRRPALYAVLVSSCLFGLAHLSNILIHPEASGALLGQTLYASFIGVGFAACYLVTRSLLPLIMIHTAINFMSFLGDSGIEPDALTFEDTLGTVIVCLPLFLLGLWLLRKEPDWHDTNSQYKTHLTNNG